jgi:hypothetical protein
MSLKTDEEFYITWKTENIWWEYVIIPNMILIVVLRFGWIFMSQFD